MASALRSLECETASGFTFEQSDGSSRFVSFAQLSDEASRRGRNLLARGLEPGDSVALIVPEPDEFIFSLLGMFAARLVPIPMYPPLGARYFDSYLDGAAQILRTAGARAIVTTPELENLLGPLARETLDACTVVAAPSLAIVSNGTLPDPDAIRTNEVALIQFTSGSTMDPRGTCVTHGNIAANCEAIAVHGLELDEGDKGVSWLPLFHDMGLVGFVLTSIMYRVPVVFIPTVSFAKRPSLWMETVHRHRGTVTFAPNFALALLTRHTAPEHLDLSCLRVLGCGAEPIDPETVRRFLSHFASAGLRPSAILPSYGMAEATLAVSFGDLGASLRSDVVDADLCATTGRAVANAHGGATREFVSCGRAIVGHAIKIVDDAGQLLADRMLGEIVVCGPSVAAGYRNRADATLTTFTPEGLRTGDIGYLVDGELFVTGRRKDVLVINGRKYDPQLVERTVEELPGVRPGRVVAFTRSGTSSEELIVVAESARHEARALAESIRRHVYERIHLTVADVVFVPGGSLPRTTSGKLQRSKVRERHVAGGSTVSAGVDM
jgi:acyl-CoA synthetase (AMP-forming)/AMP-acid ligase II